MEHDCEGDGVVLVHFWEIALVELRERRNRAGGSSCYSGETIALVERGDGAGRERFPRTFRPI